MSWCAIGWCVAVAAGIGILTSSSRVIVNSSGKAYPLRDFDTGRMRNVPTRQFWELTLYDRETCAFIRDMPRTGVDSYDQNMQRNSDGSVDIYIGPKPPAGGFGPM